MQSTSQTIVILGTGGTIAGTAANAADNVGYTAAQLGVAQLMAAVPALAAVPSLKLECEQVAQLDSKDMDFATWQRLAHRVQHHIARPEVTGVVVTHGTDTLEETAHFLQRVLAPEKPVVLTAAMRPATALMADGPQNLLDAVQVARHAEARGVCVTFAGQVHAAEQVQKAHSYQVSAFRSRDQALLAVVEESQVRSLGQWPQGGAAALGLQRIEREPQHWPRVELLLNHVAASGAVVRALMALPADQRPQGLVVAGTGNGTLSSALEHALLDAQAAGVTVWLSTRCDSGGVVGKTAALPGAGALSAVKARVELILQLLA